MDGSFPNASGAHALQDALLAAHGTGDDERLAALYEQAGDFSEAAGAIDEACFFLTQALVFALVSGAPRQRAIRERLHAYGREDLT